MATPSTRRHPRHAIDTRKIRTPLTNLAPHVVVLQPEEVAQRLRRREGLGREAFEGGRQLQRVEQIEVLRPRRDEVELVRRRVGRAAVVPPDI